MSLFLSGYSTENYNNIFSYNTFWVHCILFIVTIFYVEYIFNVVLIVCVISWILSKLWYLFMLKRHFDRLQNYIIIIPRDKRQNIGSRFQFAHFFNSLHTILKPRHTIFLFIFANKRHYCRTYWSFFFLF